MSLRGLGRSQDIIEVMTPSEADALMHALGPLPSIRAEGRTAEHSRDRLAATIALNTGLRREEITRLPLREVQQGIRLASQRTQFQMIAIRICGKGKKWRKVNVPAWLLSEVAIYIEGERAEAIASGKELHGRSYRLPSTLFVGHADSATSRGCEISSGAIYDAFAAPQQALIDMESLSHRFRFHDLRHTYAVWTWIARKRSGDVQPSKYVQAQLGHAYRETTERIYLATVSQLESQLFDGYVNFLQEAADA